MQSNGWDRRKLWDAIGYDPHPGQDLIHASNARFKIPCCGRRFGKSTSAIADRIDEFFLPKRMFWLVGPTYDLGEREYEVLVNFLQEIPAVYNASKISYSPKAGNMAVRFPWDTTVKVVSAEKPKSLQGKGLSGAIMCEAAEHVERTWTQYIRPALADKRGWATFPSTPKGFNWYYTYHNRGPDTNPEWDQWDSWRFPSWMNTHIFDGTPNDPEIVEMRNSMSDVIFNQEICAEFTSFEGKVYAEFDHHVHVVDLTDIVNVYLRHWRNYWGVDFGFRDPFVCLDIMVDPEGNVYVWREHYESGRATVQHCETLANRPNPPGFHCDFIAADPSAADGIATMQMRFGRVIARRVGPMLAIEELKKLMRGVPLNDGTHKQRFFVDRKCENLIRELNTFQIKPGETVEEKFTHASSHAPDALRYWAGEYYVLGAGAKLRDIYTQQETNVGGTYFQYNEQFVLGG